MERCGEGVNWQVEDEPVTSGSDVEALETFWRKVLEPLGVRRGEKTGGIA